jgi:hypothetical protein
MTRWSDRIGRIGNCRGAGCRECNRAHFAAAIHLSDKSPRISDEKLQRLADQCSNIVSDNTKPKLMARIDGYRPWIANEGNEGGRLKSIPGGVAKRRIPGVRELMALEHFSFSYMLSKQTRNQA